MLPGHHFKCVSGDTIKLSQLFSHAVQREYIKRVDSRELLLLPGVNKQILVEITMLHLLKMKNMFWLCNCLQERTMYLLSCLCCFVGTKLFSK